MKRTEGSIQTHEIKRCYVDNIKINEICPECDDLLTQIEDIYFSYPYEGDGINIILFCAQCDRENRDAIYILPGTVISTKMVIEYDPKKIRKD